MVEAVLDARAKPDPIPTVVAFMKTFAPTAIVVAFIFDIPATNPRELRLALVVELANMTMMLLAIKLTVELPTVIKAVLTVPTEITVELTTEVPTTIFAVPIRTFAPAAITVELMDDVPTMIAVALIAPIKFVLALNSFVPVKTLLEFRISPATPTAPPSINKPVELATTCVPTCSCIKALFVELK